MADFNTNIQYVKGVGEVRAKAMNKLGIETLGDLISYFPRDYDDRRNIKKISELEIGETVCVSAIVAAPPVLSHIRKGLDLVKFRVVDENGQLNITFFNQAYIKNSFVTGENYYFYGKISGTKSKPEMTNPAFEIVGKADSTMLRIMPIYRLTSGLNQKAMANAVRQGLNACADQFTDVIPNYIREKYSLASAAFSYENIHFPKDGKALSIARDKLIFEEFYVLACAMGRIKSGRKTENGIRVVAADINEFYETLPFELTDAQKRAVHDAYTDMTVGNSPMSRLVQGDVGSGKTVVTAACCWLCAKSGLQSAVMAPTEILAAQHFETFSELLRPFGMRVDLLTGGMSAKQKKSVKESLTNGEIDVIVGTHALLSDTVEFSKLGLAIADEQHRFGVQQRAALAKKGSPPHVLVMSATPIPRTLALIMYGELDVSVIDELPPGRQKIDTFAVKENMRERINAFIRKHVSEGRQAYIVCPMVEEGELPENVKSAEKHAKLLQEKIFPDLRVGLLHGKMKARDKEAVMASFAAGNIDILVSTTVIEVGVDVPNSVLMVVENAERFGLSQLHQLRGRVGRGKHKSYCILFDADGTPVSAERLKVMCETNDGFKISEADLKLRGPGDFFGSRQHGLPEMKIADLAVDMNVLVKAQKAAEETLTADPKLIAHEHKALTMEIERVFARAEGTMN